jgi:hypothetical protein
MMSVELVAPMTISAFRTACSALPQASTLIPNSFDYSWAFAVRLSRRRDVHRMSEKR